MVLGVYGWNLREISNKQDAAWHEYARNEIEISKAVQLLYTDFGYNGFIHHFKNFVLRGQPEYEASAGASLNAVKSNLDLLQARLTGPALQDALADIRGVVDEYKEQLAFAKANRAAMTSEEIDRLVKVDDGPAASGLETLSNATKQLLNQRLNDADILSDRMKTLLDLGFGVFLLVISSGLLIAYLLISQSRIASRLAASNAEVTALMQGAPDAVIYVAEDGSILSSNDQATSILGYKREDLTTMNVDDLVPALQAERHAELRADYLKAPKPGTMTRNNTLTAMTKDGAELPVTISLSQVDRAEGRVTIAAIRDASIERKSIEMLETARVEAENLVELKSSFLSNMSHEIRTPLTGILGLADLLAMSDLTPSQRNSVLSLKSSGRHLLELINDILDLSKLEAGAVDLKQSPFSVSDLAGELESILGSVANAKSIAFSVSVNDEAKRLSCLGDLRRIKQILVNLGGNAIKFSAEGAVSIDITLETAPSSNAGTLTMAVRDTGIGMSAEQIETIFNPFVQMDNRANRMTSGTGLGLAITKRLLNAMKGEIKIDSVEGEGSTFTIRIPVITADIDEMRTEPKSGMFSAQDGRTMNSETLAVEAAARAVLPKGLRMLVVDDNVLNRSLVVAMLKAHGIEDVDTAGDGDEALARMLEGSYDAVLLDVRMPKMDGFEVLAEFKRQAPGRRQHVIAFTADVVGHDFEEYEKAGFNGYVSKPIFWEDLERRISEGLQRRVA
jgi:PAS domain S-box-containing protein